MTNDQQYYESLIVQGHPPEHALHYTRTYFPDFYPSPQNNILPQQVYYQIPVVQQQKNNRTLFIVLGVGIFALAVVAMLIIAVFSVALFESQDSTPEFGFRHDVNPIMYEELGDNQAPYNTSDYPNFSSVVYIEGIATDGEVYSGSGVVIAERWVLTAAHVMEGMKVSDTFVFIGNDYESFDFRIAIKSYSIHPGWPLATKYSADEQDEILEEGTDIALIELEESVDSSTVDIAMWYNSNSSSQNNELLDSKIYISGFGDYSEDNSMCSEHCLTDSSGYFSKRRAWENTLDRIVEDIQSTVEYENQLEWKGGWVVYDFDGPWKNHNSLASGETYNFEQGDYSYAGQGNSDPKPLALEGTSVAGDSGGPTFALIDGNWTVIGLTSHGSAAANYGDVAFNTAVFSHYAWICSHHELGKEIPGC